ncbi:MAG: 3-keto-5-aminohexanoate cleavage protein, partial [Dehalococcoidales bacterium]|nr:3-keto-5-aminohexanoate cleavage protein [Dehalococcoidales bacterium]
MPKTIVTAAVTGSVHTPSMSPYLPVTPEQIADEAIRVCEAGGAVAHIHVRNPDNGRPIPDNDLFRDVASRVKSKCDIILCFTTGGGPDQSVADRAKVVNALKPELASCNAGSLNFSFFSLAETVKEFKYDWEKDYILATENNVFANTFKTLKEYNAIFAVNNTKPEFEVYDAGMLYNIAYLLKKGYVKKPL